jgi:hypothetical protein
MTFAEYLNSLGITKNFFLGQLALANGGSTGYLQHIISEDGKLLLNPENGRRQTVNIPPYFIGGLKAGAYYSFILKFAPPEKREQPGLKYNCWIDPQVTLKELSMNPYEKLIQDRYARLDRPESNKIIANLLDEVGKGMYSSKKRMVFELLQNADDAPAGNEVKFYVETFNDYLLVAHDGLPFNADDVKAITSAAESTKQKQQAKTGYKGIGFKSVFTDSNEVIIKSGGYFFEFNKNHPLFRDFDTFYFDREEYRKYPGLLEEKKDQFADSKSSFRGILDIPWQLLPLWIPEMPESLRHSTFMMPNNVGIALRFGDQKVKEYGDEIFQLCLEGRFLLFLRNTTSFKFSSRNISVEKIKRTENQEVEIIEHFRNDSNRLIYKVREFDNIEVSDSAFNAFEIQLTKQLDTIETGEQVYYFKDGSGNRITSIPPKIAAFEKTAVTFAAPLVNGQLQCEPTFLKMKRASYFFTYLPMKEDRISFPVLVNADFVPSSNREEIQGDNPWNEYLFAHIGYKIVAWVAELASISNPKYLSLLPAGLFHDSDSDIRLLTEKFNTYYKKGVEEIAFVLNDRHENSYGRDIILDTTGFTDVLGHEVFYAIFEQTKRLPAVEVESDILTNEVFGIEKITDKELADRITSESGKKVLEERIQNTPADQYLEFVNWFNAFLEKDENAGKIAGILDDLAFIRFIEEDKVTHYSWKSLKTQESHLVLNDKMEEIREILAALGFKMSVFSIESLKHIKENLSLQDTYLSSETELFRRIAALCKTANLIPPQKTQLALFLGNLSGVGVGKIGQELALFEDIQGRKRPLSKLLKFSNPYAGVFLEDFKINPQEEAGLDPKLDNLRCDLQQIYSNLIAQPDTLEEILKRVHPKNLSFFYDFVGHYFDLDASEKRPPLSELAIIYTNKTSEFKKPGDIHFSKDLLGFSLTYKCLAKSIEALTNITLPHIEVLRFIENYKIPTSPISITDHIVQDTEMDYPEAHVLLEFLVKANENIFQQGYFDLYGDILIFKVDEQARQFWTNDSNVLQYIGTLENPGLKALPAQLSSIPGLRKIGLLEEELLIAELISEKYPFNLGFAPLIRRQDLKLKKLWIKSLKNLEIDPDQSYPPETDLNAFFEIVIELLSEPELVSKLREKLSIDSTPLSQIAYKDQVSIRCDGVDYAFSLADLLKNLVSKTGKIATLVTNLNGIQNAESLFNAIFDLKDMPLYEIVSKIKDKYSILENAAQYVFLQAYFKMKNINFPESFNDSRLKSADVLDFCFKKSIPTSNSYPLLRHFVQKLKKFNPKDHVYPNSYAYADEKLPEWIAQWVSIENSERRIAFLQNLGLHGASSDIVKIRKFFLEPEANDSPEVEMATVSRNAPGLLKSTVLWMALNGQPLIQTQNHLNALKQVLSKIAPSPEIPVPVIVGLHKDGDPIVGLKDIDQKSTTLIKFPSIPQDLRNAIFNFFQDNPQYCFIENTFPESWLKSFKVEEFKATTEIYWEFLQDPISLDQAPYSTWPLKAKHPVFVISGQIPRVRRFKDYIVGVFKEGNWERIDKKIYINQEYISRLSKVFEDLDIPQEDLLSWYKHNDALQQLEEPGYPRDSALTPEEHTQLSRIFGNSLPEMQWKDQNLQALIRGLNHLDQKGWYVAEAEANLINTHKHAFLSPVYRDATKSSSPIKVLCQSSMQGLLYLKYSTWNSLDDSGTSLYVSLSADPNDCKFCTSKKEVLDADADYTVIRMESQADPEAIDRLFRGQISQQDDVRIIIRTKKHKGFDSIFERIHEKDAQATTGSAFIYEDEDAPI